MAIDDRTLQLLPDRSREKFENFVIERQAARAAYCDASDREQFARNDLGLVEAHARERLDMHPGVSIGYAPAFARPTESQIRERASHEARIMAPVEGAKRRLQLASAACERATERQNSWSFVDRLENWLTRIARSGEVGLRHCSVSALRSKDFKADVAKLRGELEDIDGQWGDVEGAPVPSNILRAQALAEIDRVAAEGALTLHPADRSGTPLYLARSIRIGANPVVMHDGGSAHVPLVGNAGAPVFTWLLRDALVARVEEMVAALPQAGVMTDDERDAAFTRLRVRRLEVERQEEAVILAAEARGEVIVRRIDADPRAVLEVEET